MYSNKNIEIITNNKLIYLIQKMLIDNYFVKMTKIFSLLVINLKVFV